MPRLASATLIAAFAIATVLPNLANAEPTDSKKRVRHHPPQPQAQYVAAPGSYYGMPGSYVPAPPFPFFLIPGPWWLPAH
jgi:hypothetical protein